MTTRTFRIMLLVLLAGVFAATGTCRAQTVGGDELPVMPHKSAAPGGLPYDKPQELSLAADTFFFPRLYGAVPYDIGGWQLHEGLNAQFGTSVTVGFGKHTPRGAGIGTHASFLYAVPVTQRFSVAAGISTQTFDWGAVKFRNAELTGVASYRVNDFMNVYAYGSKSLMDNKQRRLRPYPSFGRDRWGGAVDFNLGRHVFVQFGIEQARFY